MSAIWNLFNCYLSGRHDYGMWCEPGQIYLRCVHCGKRSPGWDIERKAAAATIPPRLAVVKPRAKVSAPVASRGRVVPFHRAAAS
jgi:hypothetical protein